MTGSTGVRPSGTEGRVSRPLGPAGPAPASRCPLGYAIAAYVVVLGALIAYGARVHLRRRALRARRVDAPEGGAGA